MGPLGDVVDRECTLTCYEMRSPVLKTEWIINHDRKPFYEWGGLYRCIMEYTSNTYKESVNVDLSYASNPGTQDTAFVRRRQNTFLSFAMQVKDESIAYSYGSIKLTIEKKRFP